MITEKPPPAPIANPSTPIPLGLITSSTSPASTIAPPIRTGPTSNQTSPPVMFRRPTRVRRIERRREPLPCRAASPASISCAGSDSWELTGSPAPLSSSRAPRANSTSISGSRRPCAMNTRSPSRSSSEGSQPSTVGMKPERARIPAGAGARRAGRARSSSPCPARTRRGSCDPDPGRCAPTARRAARRAHRRMPRSSPGRGGRRAAPLPVVAGHSRQGQRRAGRDDEQALLGIEDVCEAEQVQLIGPAAVVEHEQPVGITGRRTFAKDQVGSS